MYRIEEFREINKPELIVMTKHGRLRLAERGLLLKDIRSAIDTGEIIEQYEDDSPFPSCLILGNSGEKPIHIVASIDNGMIYLITTYIPDPSKWKQDGRTRKQEVVK